MTRSEAIRKAIDIVVYLEAHFAKSQKAKKEAKEIIEALEQINEEEPVNKLTQQAYEDGKKDGYLQAKVDQASNTGWIPVSEKLPNDGDYVLVCYEDGHIRTAYYYIDNNFYPSEEAQNLIIIVTVVILIRKMFLHGNLYQMHMSPK